MKVLVVAARKYNGHELWTALGVIKHAGHSFEVVSVQKDIMDEVTFQRNTIERTVYEIKSLEGWDGLMFVSGNMKDTESHWDNKHILWLVDDANARGLPIAAICCSVPTIRNAAEGKKVSFFPLIRSRERLRKAGAILQTVAVTRDQNLVTAEHQMATQMWAESFVELLEGRENTLVLTDSNYTPGGRLTKPDPDLQHLRDVVRRTGKQGVNDE